MIRRACPPLSRRTDAFPAGDYALSSFLGERRAAVAAARRGWLAELAALAFSQRRATRGSSNRESVESPRLLSTRGYLDRESRVHRSRVARANLRRASGQPASRWCPSTVDSLGYERPRRDEAHRANGRCAAERPLDPGFRELADLDSAFVRYRIQSQARAPDIDVDAS